MPVVFSTLPDEYAMIILAEGSRFSYSSGAVIVEQGDEGGDLFYIDKGEVRISLLGEDGGELVLGSLRQGDLFGEMSALDGRERSAMVRAIRDTEVVFLRRPAVRKVLEKSPDFAVWLLSLMAGRLRRANEMIETLAFMDVAGRISKLLREIALSQGPAFGSDEVRIPGLTHNDIAQRIGSSREAVTKALRTLAARGLLEQISGEIVIRPGNLG